MKQVLLKHGFTETTKNTYSNGEYTAIVRGGKVDVYDDEEWIGTADDEDQLLLII